MDKKPPKIEIIGTSHIAKESVKSIKNYIINDKPDIVALELDKQRYLSLFSKKKAKPSFEDVRRMGVMGFLFGLLASWVQKFLGKRVGMVPGADMISAINGAKKIGTRIFLIDQNINKILLNISKQMSFYEKLKFVFYLIFGIFIPSSGKYKNIDLSTVPEEKVIEDMISDFKKKFPLLYKILISDRNKHMAKHIIYLRKAFPDANILVVVGAGHKKGIKHILKTTGL